MGRMSSRQGGMKIEPEAIEEYSSRWVQCEAMFERFHLTGWSDGGGGVEERSDGRKPSYSLVAVARTGHYLSIAY